MTIPVQLRHLYLLLAIFTFLLSACDQNASSNQDAATAGPTIDSPDENDANDTPVAGETQEEEVATATSNVTVDSSGIATEESTAPSEEGGSRATATPAPAEDEESGGESDPDLADGESETEDPNERMILVPGGTYPMGGDATDLLNECRQFHDSCVEDWFLASAPEHMVELDPFYIDPYEVTTGEFLEFLTFLGAHEEVCFGMNCFDPDFSRINVSATGEYTSTQQASVFPVLGVTWFGAVSYCQWRGARLPTEAEWEMAASWEPETETKYRYPWGDVFNGDIVSFCDTNCQTEHANEAFDDGWIIEAPVGIYEDGRSPIGAYDMGGNLWEWVSDWFSETYYAESPLENPKGPTEGVSRVVRGGSWFDTGNFSNTMVRFPIRPDGGSITIGFRCARDAGVGEDS